MKKALENTAIALVRSGYNFTKTGNDFEWDSLGEIQVSGMGIEIWYVDEKMEEAIDATPKMILESIHRVRAQFYE